MAARLPEPRRTLDVAMGRGRHARALARLGLRVFGVDANLEAIRGARDAAREDGVTIDVWCADLTASPLPRATFAMVVVTRYLQRDLFPAIRDATVPGGVVIYETFTSRQRALGWGPRSAAHLLDPGELARSFEGWETLFYEEVSAPEAVARLVARRSA